jgi:hypothetical protein
VAEKTPSFVDGQVVRNRWQEVFKDFRAKKLAEKYARDLQSQVERGKQDRPE